MKNQGKEEEEDPEEMSEEDRPMVEANDAETDVDDFAADWAVPWNDGGMEQRRNVLLDGQAADNPDPMEQGYLEPAHLTRGGEAASMPVPPEQVYLELFQRLSEEPAVARVLAVYIRDCAMWMERANDELGRIVSTYINSSDGLLPRPNEELIVRFMNEFGIDLSAWAREIAVNAKNVEARDGGGMEAATPKKKLKPAQKCGICGQLRKGHLCRPTLEQVVGAVKTAMKETRATRRRSISNATKRGPYRCGNCRAKGKAECDCGNEYERVAIQVKTELEGGPKLNNAELDCLIREIISSSASFRFEQTSPFLRIPQNQLPEPVNETRQQFIEDGAELDLILEDAPDSSTSRVLQPRAVSLEEAPQVRAIHPQAIENLERLSQLVQEQSPLDEGANDGEPGSTGAGSRTTSEVEE